MNQAENHSAHVGLAAPYGVYPTIDGYLAIAMNPLEKLARLIDTASLNPYLDRPESWFAERDSIKRHIGEVVSRQTTEHWLAILEPENIWCAPVANWTEFLSSEGFKRLDMLQTVDDQAGTCLSLVRSPLRINGVRSTTTRPAPGIGADNQRLFEEFDL